MNLKKHCFSEYLHEMLSLNHQLIKSDELFSFDSEAESVTSISYAFIVCRYFVFIVALWYNKGNCCSNF